MTRRTTFDSHAYQHGVVRRVEVEPDEAPVESDESETDES